MMKPFESYLASETRKADAEAYGRERRRKAADLAQGIRAALFLGLSLVLIMLAMTEAMK